MKGPKPKKVNYEAISQGHPAFKVLEKAMKWHKELRGAKITLAWRKEIKPDKDAHIVLGRCVKTSDLQKEYAEFDFIIVLNREFWQDFTEQQRLALMDHELSHAASSEDEDGEQKEDERGRKVWRLRKHDIEEFSDVIERHGLYKKDLERFAEAIRKSKSGMTLFEPPPKDNPIGSAKMQ